jgi:hypothetical protein
MKQWWLLNKNSDKVKNRNEKIRLAKLGTKCPATSEWNRKYKSQQMIGKKHFFYGKKRPDHSKVMSKNNPSSIKIKYNDNIYNSIMDLWRSEFSDINERAFRQRINRGKIIFQRI